MKKAIVLWLTLGLLLLPACGSKEPPSAPSSQVPEEIQEAPADSPPEDSPPGPQTIEIATAEELLAAVQRINQGREEELRDTYLLTADIDLAGAEWTPMGMNLPLKEKDGEWEPGGFSGVFDGQGHTIRNLTIDEDQARALLDQPFGLYTDGQLDGIGLFYRIGYDGVVKDLRLENAAVLAPLEGRQYGVSAGLLAAYCHGRVENVSVQGRVQGVSNVGGLVGDVSGRMEDETASLCAVVNCSADVEVTGFSDMGGLTGFLSFATLRDCSVTGSVTSDLPVSVPGGPSYEGESPLNIGGLMGHCLQGRAENCRAGAVMFTNVSSRCVGSLCGLAEGGSIRACSVDSHINANWEAIDAYYHMDFEPEVERS